MSATDSFDLVVLGTGAGGSTPAAKCREAGWRVAVVDDQPYGGTCAVRGCDPKKVLVAGSQAVVLGRGTPLGHFDQDLVATLIEHSRHVGIDVRLDTSVTFVERQSDTDAGARYRVHTDTNGHAGMVEADLVVHGGGRVPNTDTLDAALGDITIDAHGGVAVNEYLQSVSNTRVYAAGDAVLPPGAIPLTPVASHEGAVIASNLLHSDQKRPDYRGIPSVVFTGPPLASVGLTEAEARRQGIEVHVQRGDTSSWYSNRRVRESVGMYKTIIEAKTDRLVGAHLLGTHVDEMINLFAVAIRCALPATELRHMIYAYPTSMSDIPYML